MKYIVKSPYPCLVKTGTQEMELDKEDCIIVEDETFLMVYPLKSGLLPFKVNFDKKHSDFYENFSHGDQNFILFTDCSPLQITHIQRLSFGGKTCQVKASEKNICFEIDGKCISILCENLKNPKIYKIKDFACVQSEKELYAYSIKTGKLAHFLGEINLSANNLNVKKSFNDSCSRVRTTNYKLEEDIIVENVEFSREEHKTIKELVPYKLLESVKARDFSFALQYLSENLKKQVDESKLNEFFGGFTTFLPVSTTEFITMSPQNKNFVTFTLKDDKIEDVSIDAL